MRVNRGLLFLSLFGVLASVSRAQETFQEAIPDWPAPAEWSPREMSRGVSTMGAVTSPLPFIGVTPCRQFDIRPGTLADNTPLFITLIGAPCGISGNAAAVSLNITVFSISGAGGNGVFKVGTANPPVTAWINYPPTETQRGNAGALPLSAGGIWVQVNQGGGSLQLAVDVNGYYAESGSGAANTFLGENAGNFTMTGGLNTGIGVSAFSSNTTGTDNTAIGEFALSSNDTGSANTAMGGAALALNHGGDYNTAGGFNALANNATGSFNTALGVQALQANTGGSANTAVGYQALLTGGGSNNVAVGSGALGNNSGGSNIALGTGAGVNLASGGFNMYLGNEGVASESATIRLGSGLQHTRLFVAGVLNSGITGTQVLISGTGQLGVASSSARYKEEIRDMGDASERLVKLRPVTFRYKGHTEDPLQFGLIAEEVEKVLPELVFHSASGQPEAVLYHELPAMLLNELQKQQKRIDGQAEEIARLLERVRTLEERLLGASPK